MNCIFDGDLFKVTVGFHRVKIINGGYSKISNFATSQIAFCAYVLNLLALIQKTHYNPIPYGEFKIIITRKSKSEFSGIF